jgi:hypothetical protein
MADPTMPEQTTPIDRAVDAAMLVILRVEGPQPVSREECEEMVRAAISTYLHETACELGKTAGLEFCDRDD